MSSMKIRQTKTLVVHLVDYCSGDVDISGKTSLALVSIQVLQMHFAGHLRGLHRFTSDFPVWVERITCRENHSLELEALDPSSGSCYASEPRVLSLFRCPSVQPLWSLMLAHAPRLS